MHCAEQNQRITDLERESYGTSKKKSEDERRQSDEINALRTQNEIVMNKLSSLKSRFNDLSLNMNRPIIIARMDDKQATGNAGLEIVPNLNAAEQPEPIPPARRVEQRVATPTPVVSTRRVRWGKRTKKKSPPTKVEYNRKNMTAADFLRSDDNLVDQPRDAPIPKKKGQGASRKGKKGDTTAYDSPLKEWLGTANSKEPAVAAEVAECPQVEEVPASPSWADDSGEDSESDSTINKSDDSQGAVGGAIATQHATTENISDYENGTPRTPQHSSHADPGKHNGARPKTGKMKSSVGNQSKEPAKGGFSNKDNAKSYSKVVSINGWKTMENKKRKRDRVSPKHIPPLKGAAVSRNKDLYIHDIDIDGVEDPDDLIEVIRLYCIDRSVRPVYIRIITGRYDCTRAGCRLTVKEEDVDKVLSEDFWPYGVRAREWVYRSRDN